MDECERANVGQQLRHRANAIATATVGVGAEYRDVPKLRNQTTQPPQERPVVQQALLSLDTSTRQVRESLDVLFARLETAGVLRIVPTGDGTNDARPSLDVPLADGILGIEATANRTRNLIEHILSRLEV